MPIPLIIWAAGAILAAGGVALAVSNSRNNSGGDDGDGGNDDGDGGNDETGSLEERLERNCRKHSKNDCFYFDRYVPFRHSQGENTDPHSEKILELKKKDQSAIDDFVERFRFLKGLDGPGTVSCSEAVHSYILRRASGCLYDHAIPAQGRRRLYHPAERRTQEREIRASPWPTTNEIFRLQLKRTDSKKQFHLV